MRASTAASVRPFNCKSLPARFSEDMMRGSTVLRLVALLLLGLLARLPGACSSTIGECNCPCCELLATGDCDCGCTASSCPCPEGCTAQTMRTAPIRVDGRRGAP